MHTFEWDAEPNNIRNEDTSGKTVYVHHNGDWSGEAIINIPIPMCTVERDMIDGRFEIKLPAKLLADVSRQATIQDIVGRIEDWA